MYLISGVLLMIASSFQFYIHNYLETKFFLYATEANGELTIPILFLIAGIYCIVCHFKYERPKLK